MPTTRALARRYLNEIDRATTIITNASTQIVAAQKKLAKVREECAHRWTFTYQVNNYHEERWNVTYHCADCQLERVDRDKIPVCRVCDSPLQRAAANDQEAEAEKAKDEYKNRSLLSNPLIAFRCSTPSCNVVHILWTLGD
ncbi:hypothetical protein K8Q93_03055 [Candidatus Parcubacteria bacterium]|nr:hypothetical protein [Candidatus Parcubacteria bacterium]